QSKVNENGLGTATNQTAMEEIVDAVPQTSTVQAIGNVEAAQLAEKYSEPKASKKRKRMAEEGSISSDEPEPKKRQEKFDKGEVKSMEYASQQERKNRWGQERKKRKREEEEQKWREKWKEV